MMARPPRWQDPEGLDTINTIVKKLIPNWANRLHAVQMELVSAILDGKSVLCCTATGNRKSAAFSVLTLVLLEYNKHLEAYVAALPTQKQPIGVVITPTKRLADNIVHLSVIFLVLLMSFGLGSQAFKTRCLCILILQRNSERHTESWDLFDRRNQRVSQMAGHLCGF